jgi:hypothetical protein
MYADITGELSANGFEISAVTVWRILRKAGFRKMKPIRKPGLIKKMKIKCLKWCIEYKDWTLEDWKNVIWSDKISVILLYRHGSYCMWRKLDKAFI